MVPLKLELKNFLSYQDLQEIDFSQHNLICLAGKNGHGKSAILDSMTWAIWGQARKPNGQGKPDESLVKIGQTKLLVIFEFSLGDDVYRIRREFWKGLGKNTANLELFIKSRNGDHFLPLTEKTIRATQKKIDTILKINYETFVNSSFLRQGNSNEFSKKSPRDRKVLLTKILGLDQYDLLKDKAAEVARDKNLQIKSLLSQEQKNLAKIIELCELEEKLNQTTKLLLSTQALLCESKQTKTLLDEKKIIISAKIEQTKKLLDEKKELDAKLADLKEKYLKTIEIWRSNHKLILQSKNPQELTTEINNLEKELLQKDADWLVKIQLNKQLSDISQKIESIKKEHQILELKKEASFQQKSAQLKIEQSKITQEAKQAQSFVQEAIMQKLLLEDELKKINQLSSKTCPTCNQQVAEEESLNLKQKLTKEIAEKIDNFSKKIQELESKKKDLLSLEEQILMQIKKHTEEFKKEESPNKDALTTSNPELKVLIAEQQDTSKKLIPFESIEVELQKLKENLAEKRKTLSLHQQVFAKKSEQNIWWERISEIKFLLKQTTKNHQQISEQIGDLERIKLEYNSFRQTWEENATKIKNLEAEQTQLLQEQAKLGTMIKLSEELKNENKEIANKISSLKQELFDFELLAEAFGKNGIQALLLEDILPEIEQSTNQILDLISETHAKVFIEPLRDLKKGGTKESLDITISDINGIRDYEMFSGGEAFRIDFALRVGISQVIASRAGTTLKTLIIDEGFGALDEEGIQLMMNCLYKISNQFEKIIVVSHLPILKEMFPVHFVVTKDLSGSKVNVEYRG